MTHQTDCSIGRKKSLLGMKLPRVSLGRRGREKRKITEKQADLQSEEWGVFELIQAVWIEQALDAVAEGI